MAEKYRDFTTLFVRPRNENVNKNDCAKTLKVVLPSGEFDNVPEFSRLYTFSM